MFCNLILFNSAVLISCITSCHLPGSIKAQIDTLTLPLFVSNFVIILSFFVLFVLVSFLFIFLSSLITDVQVGKPPLEVFVFAYKYGFIDTISSSDVKKTNDFFSKSGKMQICYERKIGPFGLAYGGIISEDIIQLDEDRRNLMTKLGYSLFRVKQSGSAMFVSCPKIPWLSYLGTWLTLRILYPKIYKYSKDHKLSAYPVVEVYHTYSVTLVVPLSKQDNFVVPEARPFMRRAACDLHHSSASNLNVSYSSNSSRSASIHSVKLVTAGSDVIESCTSFPKLANVHSKQG